MKRIHFFAAAALGVLFYVLAAPAPAQTIPPGGVITNGLARTADLKVLSPLSLWVSGTGDDHNECTQTSPCRTYQHICDMTPLDVCDQVTLTATASYTGAGCRIEGLRRCCHPGTDGGVVCGTFTATGTRKLFVRTDGGNISATVSAVTNGSTVTGQAEEWSILNGDLDAGEVVGKWAGITSDAGAGVEQYLWPITANDAGVITLNAHGEVQTHPVAGSTLVVYDSPGTLINATLGQPWQNAGPPSDAQVDKNASFIFSSTAAAASGAYKDRWITVQDMTTSLASGALVASSGPGQVAVRHIAQTNAAVLYRCVSGAVSPAVERNIFTGTGGIAMLAYSSALGCNVTTGQIWNNYAPLATNQFFISAGNSTNLYAQSNYAPKTLVRSGTCTTCRSRLDTFAGFRCTGDFIDGAEGQCVWTIDGDTLTGNALSYTLNASMGTFMVDYLGQVFSTITASGGGNSAVVTLGSRFYWSPNTVFDGAGFKGVQVTDTLTTGMSIAEVRAAGTKVFGDGNGNYWGERGTGWLSTPVMYPINSGFGPPQRCFGTDVTSSNVVNIPFDLGHGCAAFSAVPRCSCTPVITDGGVTTGDCNPRTALVGSVDFVTSATAAPINWSCDGPR